MDGGAGANQFIFNTGDVARGETVAFSGTDTFVVQSATDFSLLNAGGSLNGLDTLNIANTVTVATAAPEATFVSAQLTGATVGVQITAVSDSIQVNASNNNGVTIDLSGLTFTTNAAALAASDGAIINGGNGNDTITATNAFDTITGGLGSDSMTGGANADVFNYSAQGQGGASVAVGPNANALTGGDTITDFAQGTDDFNLAAASYAGSAANAASGNAGAWNLNNNALYAIGNVTLNFVAGVTTSADVAAAVGNVTGDAGDVAYVAIENAAGTQFNVFQVNLLNARANAAIAGTDTIAHLGTFTTTATAAQFAADTTFVG